MAATDEASSLQNQLGLMQQMQQMIEQKMQSLQKLRARTEESTSDLLWKERNDSEGKLMKLFARQLIYKIKFGPDIKQIEEEVKQYPHVKQFLYVVDIDESMMEVIYERCKSVEELCLFTDEKIRGIFYSHSDDEDLKQRLQSQHSRLTKALMILKSYIERLQNGERMNDLNWTSWEESVPESPTAYSQARLSIASYLSLFAGSSTEDLLSAVISSGGVLSQVVNRSMPPSPQPPRSSTIPRSKSDEANVGRKVHHDSTSSTGSGSIASRFRVKSSSSKPGRGQKPQPLILKPDPDDSDHSKSRSSSMSQSPRTPTAMWNLQMRHKIKHRFTAKQFLISLLCDYCNRMMFIGVKCKECNFKCHKKCSRKAPPSCGLPEQYELLFQQAMQNDGKIEGVANMKRTSSEPSNITLKVNDELRKCTANRSHGNLKNISDHVLNQSMQSADSYSTTSSASSVGSSPAYGSHCGTPNDSNMLPYNLKNEKFIFASDDNLNRDFLENGTLHDDLINTNSTISTIRSDMSSDTLIQTEDSQSSGATKTSCETVSCNEDCDECQMANQDDLHAQISDVAPPHVRLRMKDRGSLLSEWVIPYQDIEVDELIDEGRIGKVYRAKWHGEVALKVLYLENPSQEEKNDFKYKVQALRRTRHENLVLFMGACIEPPTLALVCSLCKGYTLYQHIHILGDKFEDNRLVSIIQQTAQAMSYLHARGIVHKDLKTKNIFIENQKVVITDFGLLSEADVKVFNNRRPGYLVTHDGWLCYQAPEIMRHLDPFDPGCEVRWYTKETDIYAFGTVWYELLAGMWPFDSQPWEFIIWQIGKGFKQPLSKLDISREAKDLLSMIWAYDPLNRPQFHKLLKALEWLPKRKLIRSPSQPTYLTRSANALILS